MRIFTPSATNSLTSGAASTGTALPSAPTGHNVVRILSESTVTTFVKFGASGVVATAADFPIKAGGEIQIRIPADATDWAVIGTAAGGKLYLTRGDA